MRPRPSRRGLRLLGSAALVAGAVVMAGGCGGDDAATSTAPARQAAAAGAECPTRPDVITRTFGVRNLLPVPVVTDVTEATCTGWSGERNPLALWSGRPVGAAAETSVFAIEKLRTPRWTLGVRTADRAIGSVAMKFGGTPQHGRPMMVMWNAEAKQWSNKAVLGPSDPSWKYPGNVCTVREPDGVMVIWSDGTSVRAAENTSFAPICTGG